MRSNAADKPDPLIREARFPAELQLTRALFREYAALLGIDFNFQNFEAELAELPGKYAPPAGLLLFGEVAGTVRGCVALRAIDAETCEMKRLYVQDAARGTGLGRQLAESIVAAGHRLGYRRMRLDTLRSLTPAVTLYRAMGFNEIPAYYDNPIPGVVYFEKWLSD